MQRFFTIGVLVGWVCFSALGDINQKTVDIQGQCSDPDDIKNGQHSYMACRYQWVGIGESNEATLIDLFSSFGSLTRIDLPDASHSRPNYTLIYSKVHLRCELVAEPPQNPTCPGKEAVYNVVNPSAIYFAPDYRGVPEQCPERLLASVRHPEGELTIALRQSEMVALVRIVLGEPELTLAEFDEFMASGKSSERLALGRILKNVEARPMVELALQKQITESFCPTYAAQMDKPGSNFSSYTKGFPIPFRSECCMSRPKSQAVGTSSSSLILNTTTTSDASHQ